ncbi:MAG: hypothetical protein HYR63_28940 [Proteobacteria bacterium]|nr:hypothetical protein [Pseudomonadota bacterium]
MISAFCKWLAATRLSVMLGDTLWVVPLVQTIHLLLIAAVMASALLFTMRLLKVSGLDQSPAEAARRFAPALGMALSGLALSGAILIVAEPARELTNPAFAVKMLLIAVALPATLWVLRRARASDAARVSGTVRWIGGVSLLLWIGVVTAGRWIAYLQEQ